MLAMLGFGAAMRNCQRKRQLARPGVCLLKQRKLKNEESLLALSALPWQTEASVFSLLQALGPPSIREERRTAKLSQCMGVASAHVQGLTLQTDLAPGSRALSSRAGPEPEKPQLPSACKEARLERWRWGTGKDASCLMENAIT